jgi:hypothetical protein
VSWQLDAVFVCGVDLVEGCEVGQLDELVLGLCVAAEEVVHELFQADELFGLLLPISPRTALHLDPLQDPGKGDRFVYPELMHHCSVHQMLDAGVCF